MTSTAASWTFEAADPSGQPNPFELPSFSYEKTFYMEAFDVEKWYPLFQDCTFQTQFCHVTLQEARAMVSYYRHHSLGWRDEKDMCSKEVKHLLQALQDRIQQAMDGMQDSPNYFFVRMSCRSPKDAAVDHLNNGVLRFVLAELENESLSLFEAMSREELVDRLSDAISASSPNTALDALLRAGGKVLRVENAMDAMKLLLASERVYGDLIHVIEHCVNSKDYNYRWNMKVVVREWESRVDLSNEFRCFVVGSQLTAISQYCEIVYYPQWAHREETIKKCILEEWDRIKDRIIKLQGCNTRFLSYSAPRTKIPCLPHRNQSIRPNDWFIMLRVEVRSQATAMRG